MPERFTSGNYDPEIVKAMGHAFDFKNKKDGPANPASLIQSGRLRLSRRSR